MGIDTVLREQAPNDVAIELVVGGYNRNGSGGIYRLNYNPVRKCFSAPEVLAKADNPSFLQSTPEYLYAVSEVDSGRVSTYKKVGVQLQLQVSVDSGGASPCYLSLNPAHDQLAVANYMGGNAAIFDLNHHQPKSPAKILQNTGSGPNKSRQEAPHVHWVQWHSSLPWLYAVDLGIDEIKMYNANTLVAATALKLISGDGPRHMVFHPNGRWAFLVNELSNTLVSVHIQSDGTLKEYSRVSTLPPQFKGPNQAAHIAINNKGDKVYVSNRGNNSIAVFTIGAEGSARAIQYIGTEGNWPRYFVLLEEARALIVANQESDSLVAFGLDADGLLSSNGVAAKVVQPTFVGVY